MRRPWGTRWATSDQCILRGAAAGFQREGGRVREGARNRCSRFLAPSFTLRLRLPLAADPADQGRESHGGDEGVGHHVRGPGRGGPYVLDDGRALDGVLAVGAAEVQVGGGDTVGPVVLELR